MSDDGTDDNASSQSEQPMFENAAAQLDGGITGIQGQDADLLR